jgi:hypothetical protein
MNLNSPRKMKISPPRHQDTKFYFQNRREDTKVHEGFLFSGQAPWRFRSNRKEGAMKAMKIKAVMFESLGAALLAAGTAAVKGLLQRLASLGCLLALLLGGACLAGAALAAALLGLR